MRACGTARIAARTLSNTRGKADQGAVISSVSTTKPLRVSACNALVSLRWCIHFSTSSIGSAEAVRHSAATMPIVAATNA